MVYNSNIREEEVKNRLRQDYFNGYDATHILGNIDFAVAVPSVTPQLFDTEYLLWAESKKGTHADICESFVQLIITIGKAKTFEHYLPPAFLGAFDAEKIAFISYHKVMDVFYMNDFNWNITPSDHNTKEFKHVFNLVKQTLEENMLLFHFTDDDKDLRRFIKENFKVGKSNVSKIRISKNNFTAIYQKWCKEVKPSININWNTATKAGIIDADFYLADILSKDNATLKDKLYVLLRSDHYVLDRKISDTGLTEQKIAEFQDKQKAHTQFWNRYTRPPRREYWDYIVGRRDLLVPQDIREIKGSYFTPQCWVELSQQYLAEELGEDWQDEYYIWDCCAGTGNLLNGLRNKYNIWASTLDKADVDVMHDRIKNGANLLDSHVFQFDFLNDPFDRLPQPLQDIINDEEKRKKLVIYINPPYAEAGNRKVIANKGEGVYKQKRDVAVRHLTYKKYLGQIGIAGRELFAQFIIRVYDEIPSSVLAQFSTLKIVQAPNFRCFRNTFRAKLGRNFLVPANTFDNVKGTFPIGFFIWNTDINERFSEAISDIYNEKGIFIGHKTLCACDGLKSINDWIIATRNQDQEKKIGYMSCRSHDFSNVNYNFIMNDKSQMKSPRGSWITDKNIREGCIYIAVCHCIPSDWLNDRDQFLYPNDRWKTDYEFQSNCLVYTLFNNNIQSKYGINNWIPFTEEEVDAKEKFKSHFMSEYLNGKHQPSCFRYVGFFSTGREDDKVYIPRDHFSPEAKAVMDAGRELWRYYHSQADANPDASYYDIRLYFQGTKTTPKGKVQMNSESNDEQYTELLSTLRQRLKVLAAVIEPKVYEYGFLKR